MLGFQLPFVVRLGLLRRPRWRWGHEGVRKIGRLMLPGILGSSMAQVSLLLDFRGANMSVASACATSGHALGEAAAAILRNDADVMLAGGAESTVTPLAIGGMAVAVAGVARHRVADTGAAAPR